MEVHPIEKEIGIETYSTQIPGIGGKLRARLEDFVVEEISSSGILLKSLTLNQVSPKHDLSIKNLPPACSTYNLVLEKYNIETFVAIKKLANFFKIPYQNIGFAGLKDKRAVTVQQISISGIRTEQFLTLLNEVNNLGRIFLNRIQPGKHIKLGNLNGNHFNITLRKINSSSDQIQQKIEPIQQQILSSNTPNYYGPQRFGALRPISHRLGQVLLCENYEEALKIYLTATFPQENEQLQELRTRLRETWPKADAIFPREYFYENKIIQYLKEYESYRTIFNKIFPFRYALLFAHAYQSYLFNKLLSARIKAHLPVDQAVEGDYVALLDEYSLPTHAIYEVSSHNLTFLNNALLKNKAVILAPLFGFDLNYSKHPLANDIEEILQNENLDLSHFKSSLNSKLQLKVNYRSVTFKPKSLNIKILESTDDPTNPVINFDFSLNKGTYATLLLREFMKTNPLNY
jgi:tRNA pseudouridine13 synthase